MKVGFAASSIALESTTKLVLGDAIDAIAEHRCHPLPIEPACKHWIIDRVAEHRDAIGTRFAEQIAVQGISAAMQGHCRELPKTRQPVRRWAFMEHAER